MDDMKARGRAAVGGRIPHAVLTESLVREIRASTESDRKLAARLGVSRNCVRSVRGGHTWSWVV